MFSGSQALNRMDQRLREQFADSSTAEIERAIRRELPGPRLQLSDVLIRHYARAISEGESFRLIVR